MVSKTAAGVGDVCANIKGRGIAHILGSVYLKKFSNYSNISFNYFINI